MMAMTRAIHRLSEAQVAKARPIEVAVPREDAAVDAVMKIERDKVRARLRGDRRAAFRHVGKLATVAEELEGGKPGIKRRTRWLADGGGLLLQVAPSPNDPDGYSKSWVFRYSLPEKVISKSGKVRRRQRMLGLGSLNTVSLSDARAAAVECRKMRLAGIDPLVARQGRVAEAKVAEARLTTLTMAVDEYVIAHGSSWTNRRHANDWRSSFHHIEPLLGGLPVADIDRGLVVQALTPLWKAHPETARRLRGRLERVLDMARVRGWRTGENAARWRGSLEFVFAPRNKLAPVRHFEALPYGEVAAFVGRVRAMEGLEARGLELLILTAVRRGELLQATGDEFSLAEGTWRIPTSHTKRRRELVVPLSDAAITCLQKVERKRGLVVFPLGAAAMLRLAQKIAGTKITGHGFRASFSTWAADITAFPREVVEASLGHDVGNTVERSYRRTDFLAQRRRLMAAWADWCDGKTPTAENVVEMRRA
jgi:integrase